MNDIDIDIDINVGEGWRRLEPGEVIRDGDQVWKVMGRRHETRDAGWRVIAGWHDTRDAGRPILAKDMAYRRRSADEARPATLRERTPGEAAAYAEGMAATVVADLIRERDAAIKECARLRDVVRQLSVKQFVQPHETSRARVVDEGDESSVESMKCMTKLRRERDAARAERDAIQRERDDALLVLPAGCGRLSDAAATVVQERDNARSRVAELLKDCETYGRAVLALQGQLNHASDRVAELEAAAAPVAESATTPPEPRGWLTAEEREAVEWLVHFARHNVVPSAAVAHCNIETAKAILTRESPPRVVLPRYLHDPQWFNAQLLQDVIAAIRAAGGEVEVENE